MKGTHGLQCRGGDRLPQLREPGRRLVKAQNAVSQGQDELEWKPVSLCVSLTLRQNTWVKGSDADSLLGFSLTRLMDYLFEAESVDGNWNRGNFYSKTVLSMLIDQ